MTRAKPAYKIVDGNMKMPLGLIREQRLHFICANFLNGKLKKINGHPILIECKLAIEWRYKPTGVDLFTFFEAMREYLRKYHSACKVQSTDKCTCFQKDAHYVIRGSYFEVFDSNFITHSSITASAVKFLARAAKDNVVRRINGFIMPSEVIMKLRDLPAYDEVHKKSFTELAYELESSYQKWPHWKDLQEGAKKHQRTS